MTSGKDRCPSCEGTFFPRKMGYELAGKTLQEVERDLIIQTLELSRGNRQKAAEMLGVGERTLYRRIREYSILPVGNIWFCEKCSGTFYKECFNSSSTCVWSETNA